MHILLNSVFLLTYFIENHICQITCLFYYLKKDFLHNSVSLNEELVRMIWVPSETSGVLTLLDTYQTDYDNVW